MKHPLFIVLALCLITPAILVTAATAGSGDPTFAKTLVASAQSGEPGLAVDKRTTPWTIWVTDPTVGSSTWRSTDGGASFTPGPVTHMAGGDSDIALDANGTLYITDLQGKTTLKTDLAVSVSLDQQRVSYAKFLDPSAPQGSITWDRQWVAAEGQGHSVVVARHGGLYAAWVTRDAWGHWVGPITIATDITKGGKPVFSPDGALLYVPFCQSGHVGVGRSADGGLTWTRLFGVDLLGTCQHFPVLDVDDAGTVYLTFAEGTQTIPPVLAPLYNAIYFASSSDHGDSWKPRVRVSDSATPAIFPWIVAGAPGKVDLVYYTEHFAASPDYSPPTTAWDVVLSQSQNADAARPNFTRVTAYAGFHQGSICMSGIACLGPQNLGLVGAPGPADRRVLDYFMVGATEQGKAIIIHPVDRNFASGSVGNAVFAYVDLVLDRQLEGTTIR